MIWVAWRQHRWEILAVGALTALLAGALAYYGARARYLYEALDVARCRRGMILGLDDPCVTALFEFRQPFVGEPAFPLLLIFLPAFVASYLGAPLVAREYEVGTHRLVWTQGVERLEWFLTKIALLALLLAPAALILGVLGLFARPAWTSDVTPRFTDFEYEWPLVFAYTIFALVLGVLTGAAIRRVLGAMLLSLIAFAGVRFVVAQFLRPNYLPPLVVGAGQPMSEDAWHLDTRYVDAAGVAVDPARVAELSREFWAGPALRLFHGGDVSRYLQDHGIFTQHLYQPLERYWLFQGIEAALFLGLALALLVAAVWMVRRRTG